MKKVIHFKVIIHTVMSIILPYLDILVNIVSQCLIHSSKVNIQTLRNALIEMISNHDISLQRDDNYFSLSLS